MAEPVTTGDLEAKIATLKSELAARDFKIDKLKREVTSKDRALEDRNRQLDVMAWVWCDGGCPGGVFRTTEADLTEEIVEQAERNSARLRRWFGNKAFKARWAAMSPEERTTWMEERRREAAMEKAAT